MAEPTDSTAGAADARPGLERARIVLAELACAARSVAISFAYEQRACAAAEVGGLAEAVRAAARSLEHSHSPVAAGYADCTAAQIEAVAAVIRQRRWGEIAADVTDVARRQPALFVAGAVALGVLAGRFWTASQRSEPASQAAASRAAESAVTAAIASAAGNGKLADWRPAPETREIP
jgi:hypothetical protein